MEGFDRVALIQRFDCLVCTGECEVHYDFMLILESYFYPAGIFCSSHPQVLRSSVYPNHLLDTVSGMLRDEHVRQREGAHSVQQNGLWSILFAVIHNHGSIAYDSYVCYCRIRGHHHLRVAVLLPEEAWYRQQEVSMKAISSIAFSWWSLVLRRCYVGWLCGQ